MASEPSLSETPSTALEGKPKKELSRERDRLTALKVTTIVRRAKDRAEREALGQPPLPKHEDELPMHHDGGGLYFVVDPRGSFNWVFRYKFEGKARLMGLGRYDPKNGGSLADARRAAEAARKLKAEGKDPLQERDDKRTAKRVEAAKAMTFKQCAEAYIKSHKDGWKNDKHADQWPSTLKTYVYPIIGHLPVSEIDVALVMKVLEQRVAGAKGKPAGTLWAVKGETANRVRGRMELILGWAKSRGLRSGENPSTWRGHLQHALPAQTKLRKVKHHAALPYDAVAEFMGTLRIETGVSADALAFLILTAARTTEVLEATWGEIDMAAKSWTVPAERMKGGVEHRVPLSADAMAILEAARPADAAPGDYVFAGAKRGKPLSNMALTMLMRRMGQGEFTVHGFRSTFRDWGGETTNFPSELLEKSLAHTVGDESQRAYARGALFDRRRTVMDAWAAYCNGKPVGDNVTQLHQGAA